jgi:hypothetical protein
LGWKNRGCMPWKLWTPRGRHLKCTHVVGLVCRRAAAYCFIPRWPAQENRKHKPPSPKPKNPNKQSETKLSAVCARPLPRPSWQGTHHAHTAFLFPKAAGCGSRPEAFPN